MLHPKYNRIDYGEQLMPSSGYELDYAIGTTYSLDLEALMMLPVALFYARTLEGNANDLRYDMLDSITQSAKKIRVFYQNGQLKVPHNYHHLMAYWEDGIQAITMPDHISSFHPKVWIIRYVNKSNKPMYKVLVMSRNLTFSRDWDIAFCTEGKLTSIEYEENKPLIDFIQFLNLNSNKRIPDIIKKELINVQFDKPDQFETLKFCPIGITNTETQEKYINPITLPNRRWDDMLIVSPFVDNATLSTICNSTKRKTYLLSRKDEIDRLNPKLLEKVDSWQFSTYIENAEYMEVLEDGGQEPLAQNLHAKLFVGMQNKTSHWYLGSANCSSPAQERNIEFMVELQVKPRVSLKPTDMFISLTDASKTDSIQLFEKYNPECRVDGNEQKKIDSYLREIKYDLTKMPIKGFVGRTENATSYWLRIEADATNIKLPKEFTVRIRPLPENHKNSASLEFGKNNIIDDFSGYSETALSVFLVFEVFYLGKKYSSFLSLMDIELPESRLNKIFSSIIDSKDKFLKYLAFLLGGEETGLIAGINESKHTNSGSATVSWAFAGTPVYEKLLIASSRYPEKLKLVDTLVKRLKEESTEAENPIISPDFESFWKVFQPLINNN